MRRHRRGLFGIGILASVLLATGCRDGGTGPSPENPIFDRYIAVGNSITAGFESEGINDSTQNHAYAVVFAQRFQAPFRYARLRKPGCPAPLVGSILLTTNRVGGARPTDCALVHLPLPSTNHKLALPGATIGDALVSPATTGVPGYDLFLRELYALLFGGRTLVQAMVNANPTLVSVWLGNNDALSAVTAGDLGRLTPLADFVQSLDQIVAAIANNTDAQDAIWLGVLDPQRIPLAQPGAYFWALDQSQETRPWLGGKSVNANCAPFVAGDANPLAANLVSARIIRDPNVAEIACTGDAPYLLNPEARAAVSARVAAFNDAIRTRAQQHGWIYIDTNAVLERHLINPDRIRKCQGLQTAGTLAEFEAAVRATCPHTDAPAFFGSLISFDGVHPSAEGQSIVADEMEAAVRAKHGI